MIAENGTEWFGELKIENVKMKVKEFSTFNFQFSIYQNAAMVSGVRSCRMAMTTWTVASKSKPEAMQLGAWI